MKVAIVKGTVLTIALILLCGLTWSAPRASAYAPHRVAEAGEATNSKPSQTKALFDERCARCHGRDGRGRTTLGEMLEPPDFTKVEWQKGASDDRMRSSIKDGRGEMPGFARKLSRREIAALVAYVRGFAKLDR
jgi:mono/diheme cytochrome c family protein